MKKIQHVPQRVVKKGEGYLPNSAGHLLKKLNTERDILICQLCDRGYRLRMLQSFFETFSISVTGYQF